MKILYTGADDEKMEMIGIEQNEPNYKVGYKLQSTIVITSRIQSSY